MRHSVRLRKARTEPTRAQGTPASVRNRLAAVVALATLVFIGSVFLLAGSKSFMMPGPLTSAHGSIADCKTCHTKSGDGKLSWLHGLVAGDPVADSKACLSCHKMPDTALNPHSASVDILKQSTARLTKTASNLVVPQSVRAQSIAFPVDGMIGRGLFCATCHQEHQGTNFELNKITSEQCRSCHAVKFDSFDGQHPEFESFPFRRRTRIIYDHAGHFGKHFPEVAKKEPGMRIPQTCASCHDSRDDNGVMSVVAFDKTCASCHSDQISGKERATGPKGIAFLALPGIDLASIKTKKVAIGEWPEDSEAPLTPFLKMMISRNKKGRRLIAAIEPLDLQDLSNASDDQVKAVSELAWEIKSLLYAMITGKTQEAFGDLGIGAKLNADVVGSLTASLPRDVLIAAQQKWLPNLSAEMTNGPGVALNLESNQSTVSAEPATPEEDQDASTEEAEAASIDEPVDYGPAPASTAPAGSANTSQKTAEEGRNPQACIASIFGQCLLLKSDGDTADNAQAEEREAPQNLQGAFRVGLGDVRAPPKPKAQSGGITIAQASPKGGKGPPSAVGKRNATNQNDDLLFPSDAELRALNAHRKKAGRGARDGRRNPAAAPLAPGPETSPGNRQANAAQSASIASDIDPENWAEHGGWYQQDHAIFYRPTGHKDQFIFNWLTLTGPKATLGAANPAAEVFDALTGKDAQGSCAKCHSVDAVKGRGRTINFPPLSVAMKQGRFTRFVHEPHFNVVGKRGCMTCHNLEKDRPYLKGYEQGDPLKFQTEFSPVKKETCKTCHAEGRARQDCLLCHKYHLPNVTAPVTETTLRSP